MRTTIDIDQNLLAQAMKVLGTRTKKATIEEALRRYVELMQRQALENLRGMGWEGNLDAMRRNRFEYKHHD